MIAANTDKKLKSVFKGKSSYIIWLEEPDKKAIKTAYDLARALKVKDASGKAIAVLEKRPNRRRINMILKKNGYPETGTAIL